MACWPSRCLRSATRELAVRLAVSVLAVGGYGGCNYLIANRDEAHIVHAPGTQRIAATRLAPGLHAMTNLDIDDQDDPRIRHVFEHLEPARFLDSAERICRDERIIIAGPERGTVSSSLIMVGETIRFYHIRGDPRDGRLRTDHAVLSADDSLSAFPPEATRMYIPASFAEPDVTRLHDFMRRYSFAVLTSLQADGLVASHLPLLLDPGAGPQGHLFGHMARANSHWRDVRGEVLAVFSGPHAYVSPSWYEEPGTVPTWNYVAVHARGTFHLVEERDDLLHILQPERECL